MKKNKSSSTESDNILCLDCSFLEKNVEKGGIKYICTGRARKIIDILKVKRCFRYNKISKEITCDLADSHINLKDTADYFDTRPLLKIASGTNI